jgi:amino acid permease
MKFLAVILTGLALVAPAAHAFELLNKIGLPKDEYFVVQQIYSGWWMVGLLLPLAFIANIGNAIALRADNTAMVFSVAAAALIALNLVIFVLFTQPANAATQNWTAQPDNWETLRMQWEYSHAANAGVTFIAFCCAVLASTR